MAELKWEAVLNDGGHMLQRVRVPGGWLYRDMKSMTMVYVPEYQDPEWFNGQEPKA